MHEPDADQQNGPENRATSTATGRVLLEAAGGLSAVAARHCALRLAALGLRLAAQHARARHAHADAPAAEAHLAPGSEGYAPGMANVPKGQPPAGRLLFVSTLRIALQVGHS